MAIFVLVPGGWYGGWIYDPIVQHLNSLGHQAFSLFSGPQLGDGGGNLSARISAVVEFVSDFDEKVVLCGHSYGGMVITGAADAIPERVRSLVYLDAYVPSDGDSTWSLTSDYFRDVFISRAGHDGEMCLPPEGMDARCHAYPLSAFVQRIALTEAWRRIENKLYVAAQGWTGSPFLNLFRTLEADDGWKKYSLDCSHNIPRHEPRKTVDLLLRSIE